MKIRSPVQNNLLSTLFLLCDTPSSTPEFLITGSNTDLDLITIFDNGYYFKM